LLNSDSIASISHKVPKACIAEALGFTWFY
jgi:hypothetical protein